MSFVCGPRIYKYKNWIFEYGYTGAWPLTKDWEPRKRAGRVFWKVLDEFLSLSEDQQKACRIGGGCQEF